MNDLDRIFAALRNRPGAMNTNAQMDPAGKRAHRHAGPQCITFWSAGEKPITVQYAGHREHFTEQEFAALLNPSPNS